MRLRLDKIHLLLLLSVVLGVFYVLNIFALNRISARLVSTPAELSFVIIAPGPDQCERCFNVAKIIERVSSAPDVKILDKQTITPVNPVFGDLVERHNIRNLPALIISGDVSDERLAGAWSSLGGAVKDGNVIIQDLPPYYDLAQQRPKGIVEAILLKDKTCENCFSESRYLDIVRRSGMVLGNSVVYDISSAAGEALAAEYQVRKLPALLLSPEAEVYPWFLSVWQKVGSREVDGWFVFRRVGQLGQYKEIKN